MTSQKGGSQVKVIPRKWNMKYSITISKFQGFQWLLFNGKKIDIWQSLSSSSSKKLIPPNQTGTYLTNQRSISGLTETTKHFTVKFRMQNQNIDKINVQLKRNKWVIKKNRLEMRSYQSKNESFWKQQRKTSRLWKRIWKSDNSLSVAEEERVLRARW